MPPRDDSTFDRTIGAGNLEDVLALHTHRWGGDSSGVLICITGLERVDAIAFVCRELGSEGVDCRFDEDREGGLQEDGRAGRERAEEFEQSVLTMDLRQ